MMWQTQCSFNSLKQYALICTLSFKSIIFFKGNKCLVCNGTWWSSLSNPLSLIFPAFISHHRPLPWNPAQLFLSNTVPLPRMFHPAPLELQCPLIQVLIEPSSQILHTCSLFQEAFFGHKYHLPALFSMTASTSPVGLLCSDSTTACTRFTSCPFPPTPRKLFMPSTTTAWATETSMRLLYKMMPRDVTQVN